MSKELTSAQAEALYLHNKFELIANELNPMASISTKRDFATKGALISLEYYKSNPRNTKGNEKYLEEVINQLKNI
jgi:hypothetical protein